MSIKEKLKQLPQKPGVYKMIDSLGYIIYVGKAKNLKNRVSQYFNNQKGRAPKVAEMVGNINTFNYIVTDTELDALIEECRLIKEIQPRYNRQLKTRKYVYLKIPDEQYPKIIKVHEKAEDSALYFGPFTSPSRVEAAIQYLNASYPVRKCSSPRLVKSTNGCLFRQLGTCLGVCTGQIEPDEYKVHIENICRLLRGENKKAVLKISEKIEWAIEKLEFEKAAQYTDYYLGLRHIIGKQKLVQSSNRRRNILAVEFLDPIHAKIFLLKGNRLLYGTVLNLEEIDSKELGQFLKRLIRDKFAPEKSDALRLGQIDIDEAQILYSYLKKNKDRVNSFWIPATRLNNELALEDRVTEIIERISENLS